MGQTCTETVNDQNIMIRSAYGKSAVVNLHILANNCIRTVIIKNVAKEVLFPPCLIQFVPS